MRAVTLRRPWAGAVAHLGKRIENRSRPCPGLVGERIAIHAGKGHDGEVAVWTAHTAGTDNPGADLDAQGVVALATVVGWVDDRETMHPGELRHSASLTYTQALDVIVSPWWSGPCGWVLADVVALPAPVPCRGALGVWRLPPDVEAAVRAQLARAA